HRDDTLQRAQRVHGQSEAWDRKRWDHKALEARKNKEGHANLEHAMPLTCHDARRVHGDRLSPKYVNRPTASARKAMFPQIAPPTPRINAYVSRSPDAACTTTIATTITRSALTSVMVLAPHESTASPNSAEASR